MKREHLPGGVTRRIQVNPFLRLFGQRLSTWFRGSVLCRAIPPLQVAPGLSKFTRREAPFDIRGSSRGAEKTIRLQPRLNFPPERARSSLGEYSLPTQQRALINNLPRFVSDPFIGRTLPGGGRTTSCWSSLYAASSCMHGPWGREIGNCCIRFRYRSISPSPSA